MHMHEILAAELAKLRALRGTPECPLEILETGTIRQDTQAHRDGDGWSTVALAADARLHGGHVTSVDLDIDTAERVLDRFGYLKYVTLRQGYSVDWLASMLAAGQRFDVILLDSENDAQLILHEYMLAIRLLRRPGLILVDDVVPGSTTVVKGAQLLDWIAGHQVSDTVDITERTGGGVRSGVLSMVLR